MECEHCEGTGFDLVDECEDCGRSGWVHDPDDGGSMTCPKCGGESEEPCDYCDGTGEPRFLVERVISMLFDFQNHATETAFKEIFDQVGTHLYSRFLVCERNIVKFYNTLDSKNKNLFNMHLVRIDE